MNTIIFLTLLIGFSILFLLFGIYAARRTSTVVDYFLAGRNLGLIAVTFTLIATQLGGGMLLGTTQQAYQVGIFGIYYTLGMSLGFLLLSLGFASRLQSLSVETTAQLFETRYGSPALKKVASFLSVVTLLGLVIGQIVASRTVMVSLGISNEIIFVIFWLLLIIRTTIGGLAAVAITDFYQVLYMIITFGSIFLYALSKNPGSLSILVPTTAQANTFLKSSSGISSIVSFLLMPALFSLIEQDLAQRFFAARSSKTATLSALFASIFMLLFALIPIYFGISARFFGIPVDAHANPLLLIIGYFTNDVVVAFALFGIIAAISSTADSLLCAITSNVAQDFDLSKLGIRSTVNGSRIVTWLIGCIALISSYFMPSNIIEILAGSYELSVSCLFVPLIISYFRNNLNKNAALGAIAGGMFGFVFFKIYPIYLPRELVSLILSAIGYGIGWMIQRSK